MGILTSIKSKIIVPVLAFVVLAGLAGSLIAQQVTRQSLDLAVREKGTAMARQIALAASTPLLLNDQARLQQLLEDQQHSVSDIAYAVVLDEDDNIRAHTFTAGVPLQLLWENHLDAGQGLGIALLELDGQVVYDFAVPVYVDNQYPIGIVRLGVTQGGIDAALANIASSSAFVIIILVLAGLLVTYMLSASIVTPIRRLHSVSEQVAAGFYDTKVEMAPSGDEIFQLGSAFNHMIDRINHVTGALRDSKEMLENVLNTVPQGIFWKDTGGVYMGCNEAFARVLGFDDAGQIIGKTDFELPLSQEQAEAFQAEDAAVANGGALLHQVKAVELGGGQFYWLDSSKIPILDEQGQPYAIMGIFDDITERIRAEKELEEARMKLMRSEKLATIGQLASTIAHEIRNPLGVMKNVVYYLNMFDLGENDAEIKENLDILSFEIENSNKIVGDLLDFSRIKKPVLVPANINTIVEEALNRLQAGTSVEIVRHLDGSLPVVEVDPGQIQQVFFNIASNAVQAMEQGGVLTVISRLHGPNIEISFADTGVGIPEKDLQTIFEPLFSTRTKGTGLGLALVLSLVEGHQGRITVSSEVGRGSTFTIILPVERRAS